MFRVCSLAARSAMPWKALCGARVSDYVCLRFWPAFNLADLALTAGAIGILTELLIALRGTVS